MRICVFCGSSSGSRPSYTEAAVSLARAFAARKIGLVYGGANCGLMGTIADTALAAGVEVIGVMPRSLVDKEVAHTGLSQMHIVQTMHERKAMMADFADAFIALPGGYGTLDELCEILTWSQLGISNKACAVLNVDGYFDPLLALFGHAVSERFLKPVHRDILISDSDPEVVLDRILAYQPPHVAKWIASSDR